MRLGAQPRQPLVGIGLCAVAGIAAADRVPDAIGFISLAAAVFALLSLRFPVALFPFIAAGFGTLHLLTHEFGSAKRFADSLGGQARPVTLTGFVVDEPKPQATARGPRRCSFPLRVESVQIRGVERPGGFLVFARWAGTEPSYGDRVSLTGVAQLVQPVRNPGQFDFAAYLRRRGMHAEVRVRGPDDARVISSGHGFPPRAFAMEARRWMEAQIRRGLEDRPDLSSIARGMVLGSTADTPPDLEELFRRTGTLHLFAVSGLNVAMFALIAWGVLKVCGASRRVAAPLMMLLVMFYALVTGLTPSGVRAALMTCVVVAAALADRPPLMLNSLAAAALILCLFDTNQVFVTGFQLSFLVVMSIFILAGPISRALQKPFSADPFLPVRLYSWPLRARLAVARRVSELAGVAIAAWIGSLALNLHYFHLLSPWTVLANLVVVPLAFIVLALGVLSVISAPVSPWLTLVFNNANFAIASLVVLSVRAIGSLPGSAIYMEWPVSGPKPLCELTVLDMAAGGAAHIRSGRNDLLIDCGNDRNYRWILRSYLRSRGVNSLDALIMTHGDIAHIGAALSLLGDVPASIVCDSAVRDRSSTRRAIVSSLAAQNRGRRLLVRGDRLAVSQEAELRVLFPPAGFQARVADDKALVLQLRCAGRSVLLMSDNAFVAERWLIEHEPELKSDILVKGAHVSDLSGTAEFLDRVAPAAIVHAGAEWPGRAKAPAEWVRAVEARGIPVFLQEKCGAVKIEIWPGHIEARAFLGDQIFRSNSR